MKDLKSKIEKEIIADLMQGTNVEMIINASNKFVDKIERSGIKSNCAYLYSVNNPQDLIRAVEKDNATMKDFYNLYLEDGKYFAKMLVIEDYEFCSFNSKNAFELIYYNIPYLVDDIFITPFDYNAIYQHYISPYFLGLKREFE
jgi:hypothetical protein